MNTDFNTIHTAAKLLAEGKLVAFPTETVYGLGADARNVDAIQKIFKVKNRPSTNPLIIHLSNISAIKDWASNIPEAAFILAKRFWPGPLTLVLPKHDSVSPLLTGGQDSVAIRIPNHPIAKALLEAFGDGIAAPSANRSGAISPTCKQHVEQSLGDALDYILDGGPCEIGIESTIVSLLDEVPVILRQGHILERDIAMVLELSSLSNQPKKKIESPGNHLKHYAPSKPLFLYNTKTLKAELSGKLEKNISCGVLTYSFNRDEMNLDKKLDQSNCSWIKLPASSENYAQGLYAALHDLDRTEASCILVEIPPLNADWFAVHDRLQRASVS